jgi:hypothetical protein
MLLTTVSAAALAVGAAAPAQAAVAYTGQANPGMTDATAYGYVTPGNENTVWAFAYGTSTSYTNASRLGAVVAGSSPVLVAANLTDLRAGTRYHYLLFALPYDSSGHPDWAHASWGSDETFTTSRGTLNLLTTRLAVKRGSVSIPLQCASTLACTGQVSLSARARVGRSLKTLSCATGQVALAPEARGNVSARLSSTCFRLLRSARGHRLTAAITGRLSGGQTPLSANVTLSG